MPASHRTIFTATLLVAVAVASLGAQAPAGDPVTADLLADVGSVAPGRSFWVAIRLSIADTWYVSWVNPGDAGLAPAIAWHLPSGFTAGAVVWPFPRYFRVGPTVIFGFDREVSLLARMTPPRDLRSGDDVVLAATVNWVACRDVCVPGESRAEIRLPVEEFARPDNTGAIAAALDDLPVPAEGWILGASVRDDLLTIDAHPVRPTLHEPRGVRFYPTEPGVIENAAPQELARAGAGYELRVQRSRAVGAIPTRLTGVLVSENGWSPGGKLAALHVDVALERQ